jgi:cytoskeleton protein RodZ
VTNSQETNDKDERSAGTLLRQGRETAGMSIEQVADKLNLLHSVVSSLEKDCHERIRGETFVRGYMRNYARLVGIDDTEVVNRYNATRGSVRAESRFTRRADGKNNSAGAGQIGLVLVLLGLSVAWLSANREGTPAPLPEEAASVTVETRNGPLQVPLSGQPAVSVANRAQ